VGPRRPHALRGALAGVLYFPTYKQGPDEVHPSCAIEHVYDRAEAHAVIARSQLDYEARFGGLVAARSAIETG
jgi:hypothetical protein